MVLISNDASYCGLAYVMNDPRTFNYPFSVVSPNCLPLTLAHELGHNFGMQHDHDQYTAGGGTQQAARPRALASGTAHVRML
jgi:Metallo-peptidase family M12